MSNQTDIVKVFNAINTSDDIAPGGIAWIDFWQKCVQLPLPLRCPCCNAIPSKINPLVGGHVVLSHMIEEIGEGMINIGPMFITPICDNCNKTFKGSQAYTREFEVPKAYLLKL